MKGSAEGRHGAAAVVVNDDPTQREVLAGLLEKLGLEVRCYQSAEAALASMNPEEPPAIVVTDLYMPGIDGWRFCRLLRSPEYAAFNALPILVVSATFSGEKAARVTADTGADAFMAAPVEGERFAEEVRALLEGRGPRTAPRVLIVEDSRVLSTLFRKTFEAHGYRVSTAVSAEEALPRLEADPCDVAVIDYHLPGKAGDTLLEQVLTLRPDCVCVMITGDPAPVPSLEWTKRGAAACLRKPFEPEYLVEVCARARRERALLRVEDLLEERTRELRHRLAFEKLFTSVSADLAGLSTAETDTGIARALRRIGSFASVDRAYVFQIRPDGSRMDNTHEWCAPGVQSQQEALQGLSTESFPWWMEHLERLESIHVPRVADLPAEARTEREILEAQGIRSVLVVPLVRGKSLMGFLGLDSVQAEKRWSEEDIALLRAAGERVTHTLVRKQAEDALRASESRVRRKLEALLDPGGEIGRLELADIFHAESIQSMMDDFFRLTRLPMSIIDLEGKLLVGVGWQEICLAFHRKHPETRRRCQESDRELTRDLAPGEVKLYRCKNSMWDMVTPIHVGESKVGNLFMGQFFFLDEAPDRERFLAQARRFGFDEGRYLAALERVPRLDRETVSTGMRFLTKLANTLSLLSLGNLKLARALAEKDRAMNTVREQRELLAKAEEIAHLGSWEHDPVAGRLVWSDEVYRIFGQDPQGFPCTYQAFLDAVHPDDRASVDAAFSASLREGRDGYEIEHRVVRPGTGEVRHVHERCVHVRDASGNIVRSVGMVHDITKHVREKLERERLQSQLLDARNMESIGRLAGGVAHDFNNMLQVISGHAEMALAQAGPEHPLHGDLHEIREAARRSSELTGQLLAFARKQAICPKVLDLNETVSASLRMLRRLIGESIHVVFKAGPGLWPVEADPVQIDQILTNLSANARDAMAGTGDLVIETRNRVLDAHIDAGSAAFVSGEYVLLQVSDTGAGMDRETLEHVFEPFYTTKEQGRGTGLGLATVYGIVKQNRGLIDVSSEPGRGTTVRIHLPRSRGKKVEPRAEAMGGPQYPGGTETVLLVEDEVPILNLGKTLLEDLGYTVLAAATPEEALHLSAVHPGPIDLLITDVVMPRMNGKELRERVAAHRPEILCLYMSGYTADMLARHGVPGDAFRILQKPFTLHTLAGRVRELLDGQAGREQVEKTGVNGEPGPRADCTGLRDRGPAMDQDPEGAGIVA